MRGKLIAVGAGVLAALTIAAGPAAADPSANPRAHEWTVDCPGMAPFQVTVVGAVGFVHGERLLVIDHPHRGKGLDLVECSATNPEAGTITVSLQFIRRGR